MIERFKIIPQGMIGIKAALRKQLSFAGSQREVRGQKDVHKDG